MRFPGRSTSLVLSLLLALVARGAGAQGVTTGAVSGVVADEDGIPIPQAQIRVTNMATGFTAGARTRGDGRYLVQGLEVGGPYTVTARRMGYISESRDGQRVSLSQNLVIDFRLRREAIIMSTVHTVAAGDPVMSAERTGVATVITDSSLRRLPSLDRSFTDFLQLIPEVSSSAEGLSGGGANNRYNNIQIDGASETDLFGLGDTGQPGGQARGKSIGLDAVKAYQVLLSPFDVRQGNFAGLLVNAVTRTGTNELVGSAFYVMRHEGLARNVDFLGGDSFEQAQYGFAVGGPIVRDRVHFFVAPEFQERRQPAPGPFAGSTSSQFPVASADVDRFSSLLQGYGLAAGSAGRVRTENPLANALARLDVSLGEGNRLVLRHNYGRAEDDVLERDPTLIPLSSNSYELQSTKNATVAQLYSSFASGLANELIVGFSRVRDRRRPAVRAPQISVSVPSTTGPGSVVLRAGSESSSQGTELDQDILEITDNVTVPVGEHRLTVGVRGELYEVRNLFAQNSYGSWEFLSLDSLATGDPSRYQIGLGMAGTGRLDTRFRAAQLGAYVQDQWQLSDRLLVTGGVRVDVPWLRDQPSYNPVIEAEFGRRTDEVPSGNAQISPRLGFNWALAGDRDAQLRGGVGLFAGPPPFVWIGNAFSNTGRGIGQLTCIDQLVSGRVPSFTSTDPAEAPTQCGDGASAPSAGDINLLSEDLRFPQNFRASLAFDRRYGNGWVATIEGLYTKAMEAFFYTNRALAGVQGRDRNGRALYGSIAPNGVPSPVLVTSRRNVIDVRNSNRDWSYNLTASVQRRFTNQFEARASYTFSQARDVQSLTSSVALSNWRFGRAVSDDHLSEKLERSRFELPHRLVLAGTYAATTRTDLSFTYVGQSGSNFDYVYAGSGGRGDLNADGSQGNDLVYIPLNSSDPTEIRFSGVSTVPGESNDAEAQAQRVAAQQGALEQFISANECLDRQRGEVMRRNSCRTPWTNTLNVSIRQSLPAIRGQSLSLHLDVFNFLNLINRNWGHQARLPGDPPLGLLTHVGQTAGPATGPDGSQGIFTFDPDVVKLNRLNAQSVYQMQLGVRYSF